VIGLLGSASAGAWTGYMTAFRQGLEQAGYAEGRNVAIEARWADNQYDRLPALALELVRRQPTVMVAFSTPAARAAHAATSTIPIVFTTIGDPVQMGLVASLARPGGNMTGVTILNVEVAPKLLEILHEAIPASTRMALLANPTNPTTETASKNLQSAAATLGLELHVLHASTDRELDAAFTTLRELRVGGLVIASDVFFNTRTNEMVALVSRHGIPAISQHDAFATAGGLMSYSGSIPDSYRQAGLYVGRILNGEKPTDLPVMQTTKVELIVNLKTARILGVTVPLQLLGRADEVLE